MLDIFIRLQDVCCGHFDITGVLFVIISALLIYKGLDIISNDSKQNNIED